MTGRRRSKQIQMEEAWPWIVRFVGLGIVVYETLVEHVDRPSLLGVAALMIGLAQIVKTGRKSNGNDEKP